MRWLLCYTWLQILYAFSASKDNTCGLVTKDTVPLNHKRADGAGLPEVDVGPCGTVRRPRTWRRILVWQFHTRRCR